MEFGSCESPDRLARLAPNAILGVGRTRVMFTRAGHALPLPLSSRTEIGVVVGISPAMRRVFALLERAATSDASVLIQGETGTGKEAAAESIHRESARRDGPFLVLDCGVMAATNRNLAAEVNAQRFRSDL